ncbi:MAG: DUF481 domain-containing protein [Bacteroidetes bacterium]|nr:DUF481 domain-containing protein [Bacteroidota bacterium]
MRFKIFVLLFCVSIVYTNSIKGQIINIDKSDTADYNKKAQFNFNFSTGLEVDKQQTTLWDATNTAEMMLQKNKDLLLFAASYRFTYNGPEDILNAGYFHLRYRSHYKDKFQPEPFLQYQWDNKRGLEMRYLGGANIRYNMWKGDKLEFNAGLGLMYEVERWNYDGVDTNKVILDKTPITNKYIKLNSYVRMDWKPNSNNDIAINVFFQTRPDSFHPRIAPHIQWNINAGKHVGFSISYSGMYDESPVVPIHNFYFSLSNSILVKL